MDQGQEVKLTSDEFRCLVMDKWDWMHQFVGSNAMYSAGTRRLADGIEDDDSVESPNLD